MRRIQLALLGVVLVAAMAVPAATSAAPNDMVFYGALSGAAEVPPATTEGSGSAYVIVNAARTKLTYVVTYRGLTGPVVGAHIHVAPAGAAGPVVLPLRPGRSPMIATRYAADVTPAGGVSNFRDLVAAMLAGRTYVNVHTQANPAGELRAQLRFRPGDAVVSGALSPQAEVPPAQGSEGTGSAFVILSASGDRATYIVTYRGLTGPVAASHIHVAPAGAAGPIILPLRHGRSPMVGTLYASNLTPNGGVDTFDEAIEAMVGGGTYVNLHTQAHPGGEVRAQLR